MERCRTCKHWAEYARSLEEHNPGTLNSAAECHKLTEEAHKKRGGALDIVLEENATYVQSVDTRAEFGCMFFVSA